MTLQCCRLHRLVYLLCFIFLASPPPVSAFSDLLAGTLIDGGTSALGRGGMERLPSRQETLDFNSPLYLDSNGKYRVEAAYEYQPTAYIYSGRWEGSKATSDRLELAGAAPFSIWGGNLEGSIAAGYGYRASTVRADSEIEELHFHTSDHFDWGAAGTALKIRDRVSLGISLLDSDYRRKVEVPCELEVGVAPWLKIGYRRSYLDFASNVDVSISGHYGNLPLHLQQELNQIGGTVDLKGVHLKYYQDVQKPRNRNGEARVDLPGGYYLVGSYSDLDADLMDVGFTADGNPGGRLKAALQKRLYRVGAGWQISERWNTEINYRRMNLDLDGGGFANSSAVVDFWPSLLIGNYNYIASARIDSSQYHASAEYRGERFQFSAGLQYLDIRPAAKIDYWRSQFLGLGTAGAGTTELAVDRIQMLFLAFGVGYQFNKLQLRYAFGQFIPFNAHDKEPEPSTPDTGSGDGGNPFSSAWDKVRHYPGGGVHRIQLSVSF